MQFQTKSLRYIAHALTVALVVTASGASAGTGPVELPAEFVASTRQVVANLDGTVSPEATTRERYLVLLREPPLALYNGSEPGLATIPRVQGGRIDVESSQAQAYVNHLEQVQNGFLGAASDLLGRSVAAIGPQYRMQHAVNGMVLELSPAEANVLSRQEAVLRIEAERFDELDSDVGPTFIGAGTIWNGTNVPGNLATRGEGVVIAVLDTGANLGSPSFADVDIDGYDHVNPLGTGNFLGWCNPTHPNHNPTRDICSDKVIGGWDWVDALTVAPNSDAPGFEDNDNHGSHTASTAAGSRRSSTINGIVRTISGVAPRANLVIHDVCNGGPTGGCPQTATVPAINQVVADGIVDVINYSISGGTSPWNDAVSLAFLGAQNAGVVVAASAGNSGPGPNTLGHVEPWTISSAASTHTRVFGFDFDLTGPALPPANTQNLGIRPGGPPIATVDYTAPLVVSPTFNNAINNDGCSAFPAGTFTVGGVGALAVLRFLPSVSSCFSGPRRTNALNAGATGVLFVVDFPTGFGASGTTWQMNLSQWNNVQAHVNTGPSTASVFIDAPVALVAGQGDALAGFSSRGPNPFAVLKPDVTNPGFEILAATRRWVPGAAPLGGSVDPLQDPNVGLLSGTSMSSPHTAGSAALLRALNRSWTPTQVKSALMTTALTTNVFKENGITPSDPFDRGAGRVDLTRAAKAGLVFDESGANYLNANPATGGNVAALNLASFQQPFCVGTCTFPRTVRSTRTAPVTWTATVEGLPVGAATVSPPNFTVTNSGTANFTLNVNSLLLPANQYSFGEVVLTPSLATIPTARMPIAVQPAVPDIETVPSTLSATVGSGQSTTRPLTIRNVGNPTLNWSYDTGIGTIELLTQGNLGSSGFSTNFYNNQVPTPGGIYSSDDLTPSETSQLSRILVEGFMFGTGTAALNTIATSITFKVYSDAGGVPAGNPEAGVGGELYSCTRTPTGPNSAGLSFLTPDGGFYALNTLAATGCPAAPNLTQGTKYWVAVYPAVPGTNTSRRWVWDATTAGSGSDAVRISPLAIGGAPTAWTGFGAGGAFATTVSGDVQCGAPWLSVNINSAALGVGGQSNVTVTMDAAALAPGSYRAFACFSTNGTDPDEPKVVVPVSLTVGPAPTNPSGTGLASPANSFVGGTTLLTVDTTPGTNPASTGLGVAVNLSSIGGSATQQFSDDGVSNGDLAASDGRYSFLATVGAGTTAGNKTLTATISDAQARSGTTDIALTIDAPTSPSGTGAADPSTVARGGTTLLTVNVTPGASPASTGIAVVANLSSIGSGTAQAFFDDGMTGGDLSAGDGIWSLRASVAPDTVAGVKSLAVTITDAQGRSGATNIGLTVSASTAPSGIGAASPASLQVGATTLLTVTVTPGTSPSSTGIGVVSNLSSIGGNVSQTFYDDGTNGDLVAGNNVFSFSSTIAAGTSLGAKSLPVSIADAQLRTASSTIGLTVVGPSIFGSGFE